MLGRIMVAIDGSGGSLKAARHALALARSTGAHVTLLTVLEQPSVVPFGPLEAWAAARPESDAQLTRLRAELDTLATELPPGQVDKRVEYGVPAEAICAAAEDAHADLLVVGSRGHGPLGRWLLGSVSDRVVHHAKVPVTVVR